MAKWRKSSADSQSNFTAFYLENDDDDEEIFNHCFVYMGVKIIGKLTMLSDYSDLYKKPNYIYSFEFENKNMNDIDKLFDAIAQIQVDNFYKRNNNHPVHSVNQLKNLSPSIRK